MTSLFSKPHKPVAVLAFSVEHYNRWLRFRGLSPERLQFANDTRAIRQMEFSRIIDLMGPATKGLGGIFKE